MSDVMIDLETLSTRSDAVILTIGAVKFDRKEGLDKKLNKDTFYRRVTIGSCRLLKMHISHETYEWWNKQNKEVKEEAFEKDRVSIQEALQEFVKWFGDCQYVWSHGSGFDIVILENAFRKCEIKCPWMFFNCRDTRTLYDIANVDVKKYRTNHHHALYDCYSQIKGVQEAYTKLF